MRWLEREARGKWVYFYIFICLTFTFVYTYSFFALIHFFNVHTHHPDREGIELVWYTPFLLFVCALIEEIVFRFLPLHIVIDRKWSLSKILLVAAVMSVVFGIAHGGIFFILIQGVFGFVCSIMFLKCGGLEKRYFKAVAVTTTVHFLWNGALATLAYVSGLTSF